MLPPYSRDLTNDLVQGLLPLPLVRTEPAR
jgi:hypothetical protein